MIVPADRAINTAGRIDILTLSSLIKTADIIAVNPTIEPTLRSIPPEIMTIVLEIATIPIIEACLKIFPILYEEKNESVNTERIIMIIMFMRRSTSSVENLNRRLVLLARDLFSGGLIFI